MEPVKNTSEVKSKGFFDSLFDSLMDIPQAVTIGALEVGLTNAVKFVTETGVEFAKTIAGVGKGIANILLPDFANKKDE